jgi:hypothetical protein
MAAQKVQSLSFGVLRVSLDGVRCCVSFILVSDNLLAAFVKVDVEEDKLFNAWHSKDSLEIKVNFTPLISKVLIGVLG